MSDTKKQEAVDKCASVFGIVRPYKRYEALQELADACEQIGIKKARQKVQIYKDMYTKPSEVQRILELCLSQLDAISKGFESAADMPALTTDHERPTA